MISVKEYFPKKYKASRKFCLILIIYCKCMKIYISKYSYLFLRYKKLILFIISCSPIIINSASSINFLLIFELSGEIMFSSMVSFKFILLDILFFLLSFLLFNFISFDFCDFNIGFLLLFIVLSFSLISFLFSSFVVSLILLSSFGACCSISFSEFE